MIGQPSESGAYAILNDERDVWHSYFSAHSQEQYKTQATNNHTKLTGNKAAINLLSGKRIINIVGIIHASIDLCHSSNKEAAIVSAAPLDSLNIEILHIERVLFYEAAARFYGIAHQDCEHLIGLHRIIDLDVEDDALFRVQRGLP